MLIPVATGIEPGKCVLERRVSPAACQPRRIVHDPQASQSLNQVQLAGVKAAKFFIAPQQGCELGCLLVPIAGEEHPQILHRGPAACVVQVHNVKMLGCNEDIAGVKVGMQSELLKCAAAVPGVIHTVDDKFGDAGVCVAHLVRNEFLLKQVLA